MTAPIRFGEGWESRPETIGPMRYLVAHLHPERHDDVTRVVRDLIGNSGV